MHKSRRVLCDVFPITEISTVTFFLSAADIKKMLFHTVAASHPRRQLSCIGNTILSSQKNIYSSPDHTMPTRMPSTKRYNSLVMSKLGFLYFLSVCFKISVFMSTSTTRSQPNKWLHSLLSKCFERV